MPARVRLGVDRSPVFSGIDEVHGGPWDILVAVENDRVVGFIDLNHVKFAVGGKVRPATYVGLAGVEGGSRGTTAFDRLLAESENTARSRGSEFAFALINANNERLSRLTTWRYKDSVRCENLVVSCIALGPHYVFDKEFIVGHASLQEIPEIFQLIRRSYSEYHLAPWLDRSSFVRIFKQELSDFLVARNKAGGIVATLGLWDQSRLRRTIVTAYGPGMVWLRRLSNGTRYFTRIKRMPDPGGYFNCVYSIYAACERGCERALTALLRVSCAKYASREYDFLIFAFPESSGLAQACKGLWQVTNINVPVIIPLTKDMGAVTKTIKPIRLFVEYALS